MYGLIVMVIWYIFWIVAVGLLQCQLESCVSPGTDIISPKTNQGLPVPSCLYPFHNCMSYHSPTNSQPMASIPPYLSSTPDPLSPPVLYHRSSAPLKIPNGPRKTVLGSSYFPCSDPINVASGLSTAYVTGKIEVSSPVFIHDTHRAYNNVFKKHKNIFCQL